MSKISVLFEELIQDCGPYQYDTLQPVLTLICNLQVNILYGANGAAVKLIEWIFHGYW